MHALSQQKIHIHVKFRYKNPYFTRFFSDFTIDDLRAALDGLQVDTCIFMHIFHLICAKFTGILLF